MFCANDIWIHKKQQLFLATAEHDDMKDFLRFPQQTHKRFGPLVLYVHETQDETFLYTRLRKEYFYTYWESARCLLQIVKVC